MSAKATPINYKKLLALELRDNLSLFIIGFSVLFIFTFSGIFLVFRLIKPTTFNKSQIIQKPSKSSPIASKTYTVKPGDTLALISLDLYGTIDYALEFAKINNIIDPNNIETGMQLILPNVKPKSSDNEQIANGSSTGQVTFKGSNYKVQEGDQLFDIAVKAYGDGNMWVRIAKANNLTNPDQLTTGMILKIPRK